MRTGVPGQRRRRRDGPAADDQFAEGPDARAEIPAGGTGGGLPDHPADELTSTTGRLPSSDPLTRSTKAATSCSRNPAQASRAEAAVFGCFPRPRVGARGAGGGPHPLQPSPPSVEAGRPRLLTRCLFFCHGGGGGGQPAPGNRKASVARVVATGEEEGRSLFCFPCRGCTERKGSPTASHQNHLCAGWNYPRGQSDLHLRDWTFFWGWGVG